MASKAGVWIDNKQALVVLLTAAGQEIKKIAFDIGQPVRSAAAARPKRSSTSRDYVPEDTLERKVENDRKDYFNEVIAAIRGADSLLILGPGLAKGEFSKHITAKKLRGLAVELETADKMTDRQIAAKVSAHFSKSVVGKAVAPTNTAKRKAARATSEKRTKNSGK